MNSAITLLAALLLAPLAALHAADPVQLWDERLPLLKTAELPVLKDVRFSAIKPYDHFGSHCSVMPHSNRIHSNRDTQHFDGMLRRIRNPIVRSISIGHK